MRKSRFIFAAATGCKGVTARITSGSKGEAEMILSNYLNALTFETQGDRHIVYAGIDPDRKRIGFVQRGRGPRGWDAIDTESQQGSGFASRDAAAHWLLSRSHCLPPCPE